MSVQLRVFNGTGFKVRMDLRTEGVMLFDDRHKVQPISLKRATGNNDPIIHGNDAVFILVLTLHPDEAKQLSSLLDNGKPAYFSYNTFKIHISTVDGPETAHTGCDLPFAGDGLSISKGLVVGHVAIRAGHSI